MYFISPWNELIFTVNSQIKSSLWSYSISITVTLIHTLVALPWTTKLAAKCTLYLQLLHSPRWKREDCPELYAKIYLPKREFWSYFCLITKSCPTLCDPMDCSPPDSSVQGILQARILDWVTISSSRGSFWPRDWTHISCMAGWFFITGPPGKPFDHIVPHDYNHPETFTSPLCQ